MEVREDPFAFVGDGPTGDMSESGSIGKPVSEIEQLLADGEPQQPEEGAEEEVIGEEIEQVGESEDPIEDVSPDGDPPEQEEELYTITVDGEESQVTLDELQAGYRRQADYTRKTQQLAEERNQFTQESQQVQQEREQYKNLVTALGDKLKDMTGDEPDWQKMASEDPAGYVQQKAAWDQRQTQIQAAEQEKQRLQDEDTQKQQQGFEQYMQHQRQSLLTAKPELSEPEKATAFFSGVNQYAKSQFGFTDQELGQVLDHRFLLMAEKAMQFDQMQKTGKPVVKKLKQRAPLKPGARKQDRPAASTAQRKAQNRLERTGSTRDAASLIEGMLD